MARYSNAIKAKCEEALPNENIFKLFANLRFKEALRKEGLS